MKAGIDWQGVLVAVLDTAAEDYGDDLPALARLVTNVARRLAARAGGQALKDLRRATKEDIQEVLTQSELATRYAAQSKIQLDALAAELSNQLAVEVGARLKRIEQALGVLTPDCHATMAMYLQRELRRDSNVRLEQAGHAADQPTPLGEVFIDLPACDAPAGEPPPEQPGGTLPPGILTSFLREGERALRPSVLDEEARALDRATHGVPGPMRGRYVLIGGPGQGKSTLGQQLCQLYRTAWLRQLPSVQLSQDTQELLQRTTEGARGRSIHLPRASRLPFRVILSELAAALSEHSAQSILDFLAQRIGQPENPCSATDMANWLATEPWLLVIDGLDEVPTTANRGQVLEVLTAFLDQARYNDADLMVVATTRPQGYGEEFSPHRFRHLYLAPLSNARAIQYAERLVRSRYPDESERQNRILKRMKASSKNEATARLMRSPLQVAILITLVDRVGEPPRERWRLFRDYFEIVYQRETERDIPSVAVLREMRADIVAIHHQVALELHVEAETAGNPQARMDRARFERLVRARLEQEEHAEPEISRMTLRVIEAALHRLVFLVGVEADRVGFEVRSLQEFMAAEALCAGPDETVQKRLETIAPIAHWRNVFVFAAGRCFGNTTEQHRRDALITLCSSLSLPDGDLLHAAACTGGALALELLADGVADQQPKYLRLLTDIALELLKTSDISRCCSLAGVFAPDREQLYRDRLSEALAIFPERANWGVWATLVRLIEAGRKWAEALAEEHWPAEGTVQQDILSLCRLDPGEYITHKVIDGAPSFPPGAFTSLPRPRPGQGIPVGREIPTWLDACWSAAARPISPHVFLNARLRLQEFDADVASVVLLPLDDGRFWGFGVLEQMPRPGPSWIPLIAAGRFARKPSAQVLAEQLEWLARDWSYQTGWIRKSVPWPLGACMLAGSTSDDLRRLADAAVKGNLGDVADWRAAEARWRQAGVLDRDLPPPTTGDLPFDQSIGERGFPFSEAEIVFETLPHWEVTRRLLAAFERSQGKVARSGLAELLMDAFGTHGALGERDIAVRPKVLVEIHKALRFTRLRIDVLASLDLPGALDEEWSAALDEIGRLPCIHYVYWPLPERFRAALTDAWDQAPSKRGLMRLAADLCLVGWAPRTRTVARVERDELVESIDRHSYAICRLCAGAADQQELDDLLREVTQSSTDEASLTLLLRGLWDCVSDVAYREGVLRMVSERRIRSLAAAAPLAERVSTAVGARLSELHDSQRCRELALPIMDS